MVPCTVLKGGKGMLHVAGEEIEERAGLVSRISLSVCTLGTGKKSFKVDQVKKGEIVGVWSSTSPPPLYLTGQGDLMGDSNTTMLSYVYLFLN